MVVQGLDNNTSIDSLGFVANRFKFTNKDTSGEMFLKDIIKVY